MPIDSQHAKYKNMIPLQRKCRVVLQGEDAVKAAGTEFLPMLGGQKVVSYNAYKLRASFFAATARTLAGLVGVVFRKPPKIEFPKEDILESITLEGDDIHVFLRNVFNEVSAVGRIGLLGDPKDGVTFPHIATYQAESIINWRTATIKGNKETILVVLEEKVDGYVEDAFEPETKTLYRVLTLSNLSAEAFSELELNSEFELAPMVNDVDDAFYAYAVYEKDERKTIKGKEVFRLVEGPIFPTIRGKRMKGIPFVAINPTSLSIDKLENPPVLDVANVNLSHFRSSADLKHGLHFTALPTAWVAGFKLAKTNELMIGSESAWVSEDPNANAGYLEFTGAGLKSIRDDMKDMEAQMAILGARLLEAPKKAVESAETDSQRKVGEESIIGSIAGSVGSGVEKLLKIMAEWMVEDPTKVSVQLNKDYMSRVVDPALIQVLMSAMQIGRLSYDTFAYNLMQGEIFPDGRTVEEELQLIEQNPPMPGLDDDSMNLEEEEEEEEDEDET